jgi:hypothetical protein
MQETQWTVIAVYVLVPSFIAGLLAGFCIGFHRCKQLFKKQGLTLNENAHTEEISRLNRTR